MLVYKIQRGISRLIFIMKFLYWKILYRKGIFFPLYYISCIDSGAIIKNINGKLIFKGKFVSRRNLSINVNNGTLIIGKDVFFNQGVSINCQGRISIGDYTILGEDVKMYDHNHRFALDSLTKDLDFKIKDIRIGNNVWLGSNVVVLSGVTIGDNSVVSAGSVVRENIPSNMIFKDGEYIKIVKKGSF